MGYPEAEIAPFIDGNYLVSYWACGPSVLNSSGNGVLYTGIWLMVANPPFQDRYLFKQALFRCMPTEGLLHRSPTHPDQEGPDDYIGLAAAAYASQTPTLAQEVLDYGKRHFWFFNNENPGSLYHKDGRFNWSACLWRLPAVIGALYYAANKKPLFILRLAIALSVLLAGYKRPITDTDSRILSWLMIKTVDNRCWLTNMAARIWQNRLVSNYPHGMRDVADLAYVPDHPFTRYFPSV